MKILFFYRGAESFGIEYISSFLKAGGHRTELIFDPGFDDTFYFESRIFSFLKVKEKLLAQAKRFSPDLLAFSATTNLYPYVKDMACALKEELRAPAIIGGIHASVLPEYVLGEDCFDMLCTGEGEYAMLELADRMAQGRDFSNIDNLWVKQNKKITRNPERPLIKDLDTLPLPDKDMFYDKGAFYKSIQVSTSRGCPYRCAFCINSFYFNRYGKAFLRRKSPARAIEDLKIYKKKYAPKFIDFQDDVFASSPEWLEEFSVKYKKEIGIKFLVNIHPAMVNKRIAGLLKEAGCLGACMGVQTGDEALRGNLLKRKESNAQIKEAAKILREADIRLVTEFIFGLPKESAAQAWESVLLNEEIGPKASSTFVFYPFPGTELAEYSAANGLLSQTEIKQINEGAGSYHTSLFLKNANNHFFLNLSYLLPLYVKARRFIKREHFRKICRKDTSWLHRILGLISLPFHNPFLFKEKSFNYLRMLGVYLFS